MERAGGLMTDGFGHNRANAPLCGYAWGRGVMKPWGRYGLWPLDKNKMAVRDFLLFAVLGIECNAN
jgi:hypothetical protein